MINNPPKLNPEQYAQQYAQKNNMSIEQARVQLESQYGKPQAPQAPQQSQGNSNAYANLDIFEKMELLNQFNKEQEGTFEGSEDKNPIIGFFEQLFQGLFSGDSSKKENDSNSQAPKAPQRPSKDENETKTSNKKQDPDTMAKEYMEQYNEENPDEQITLDEAKAILEEKYGKPEQK